MFLLMRDSDKPQYCCGRRMNKIPQVPNLKTDTSFFATGHYDSRVCDSPDDRIEGRKDWERRLDEKNLKELDWAEVNKKPPRPEPLFME